MKRLLPLLIALLLLSGCGKNRPTLIKPHPVDTFGPIELFCLAESEDEAREIAEQYGIEFVSFSYRVAVFRTEESARTVMERGEREGLPPLEINSEVQLFEDSSKEDGKQ